MRMLHNLQVLHALPWWQLTLRFLGLLALQPYLYIKLKSLAIALQMSRLQGRLGLAQGSAHSTLGVPDGSLALGTSPSIHCQSAQNAVVPLGHCVSRSCSLSLRVMREALEMSFRHNVLTISNMKWRRRGE